MKKLLILCSPLLLLYCSGGKPSALEKELLFIERDSEKLEALFIEHERLIDSLKTHPQDSISIMRKIEANKELQYKTEESLRYHQITADGIAQEEYENRMATKNERDPRDIEPASK